MKKFKKIITPNGTTICYVRNNVSNITIVDVMFNCGDRCDTISGLAHFTEHMFLSGTKELTKEEITKKYFDFVNVNMFTSRKEIVFSGSLFNNEFAKYLETVAEMITKSTFTKSAVEKEIPIVQQEIARSADKYEHKAFSFNKHIIQGDRGEVKDILGTAESVQSIKSKDVKDFVKKYFIRENMEVYVSSPLPLNKIKSIVMKSLESKIPSNRKFNKLPLYNHYVNNDNFYNVKNAKIDKNYIRINFFNNYKDNEIEKKAKIDMVLRMMNDFSSGILKHIRLKKSLVYNGSFGTCYNDKSGYVTFKSECEEKNINELIRSVAEYLNNLMIEGFSKEQLDKAKREVKYIDDSEEPSANRQFYDLYQYKYYNEVADKKKLRKKVYSLTLKECNDIFKDLFANKKFGITIYGDADKKSLITKKEIDSLFQTIR